MNNINKIFSVVFFVLLIVVIGEGAYYFSLSRTKSTVKTAIKQESQQQTALPKKLITPIPEKYMTKVLDPYYQYFQRVTYEKDIDRFCIDFPGITYSQWRYWMGVDYAAWTSIATLKKDQVDSMIVTVRIKGTISDLDLHKIENGQENLFFNLIGTGGSKTDIHKNQGILGKTKFLKMVDGKEVPMDVTELKNGDKIIMEGVDDLTKPPKDPGFTLEEKFIKQ
jgi:hypothetical protein